VNLQAAFIHTMGGDLRPAPPTPSPSSTRTHAHSRTLPQPPALPRFAAPPCALASVAV
jgi:hypothetical protein